MGELTDISTYMAYVLRHNPSAAGITLDKNGWAEVDAFIEGVSKTHPMTLELLEQLVACDDKGRYAFSADKTRIRANQGHSIPVDVELKEVTPPSFLYHGTAEESVASIEREGLKPMSRLYVHLSDDYQTAVTVGARHGTPTVYTVDTHGMHADGYRFYLSANGVYLTDLVPPRYLKRLGEG